MAYLIDCWNCDKRTVAENIVRLLGEHHTDERGSIRCKKCGSSDARIHRKSQLQEKGEYWERWIESVIPLDSGVETYVPYVLLTADEPGKIRGVHFGYYKDLRESGGRLKHGHGPGGAPVLSKQALIQLLEKLGEHGVVTAPELEELAARLRDGGVAHPGG